MSDCTRHVYGNSQAFRRAGLLAELAVYGFLGSLYTAVGISFYQPYKSLVFGVWQQVNEYNGNQAVRKYHQSAASVAQNIRHYSIRGCFRILYQRFQYAAVLNPASCPPAGINDAIWLMMSKFWSFRLRIASHLDSAVTYICCVMLCSNSCLMLCQQHLHIPLPQSGLILRGWWGWAVQYGRPKSIRRS